MEKFKMLMELKGQWIKTIKMSNIIKFIYKKFDVFRAEKKMKLKKNCCAGKIQRQFKRFL